jgi:DNA polymerase III delta prime subunit
LSTETKSDENVLLSPKDSEKKFSNETERNSKRRRTEKSLPPKPEKKAKKASLDAPQPKVILENQELWTEKYQFKNEDEIVTNNSQFERLKEWLTTWKSILSKDQANNKSKTGSNNYDSSDSEYAYDSDASNTSSCSISNRKKFYSNAILLSGPYGCGKTSSVYSVAKSLGFKVFEVNASSLRNKYQIIQELEGALNSHHVSNNNSAPTNASSTTTTKTAVGAKKDTANQASNFKMQNFFKLKPANPPPTTTALVSPVKINEKPPVYVSPQTKTRKKRKISLRKETFLSSANKHDLDSQNDTSCIELDTSLSLNEEAANDSSSLNSGPKIHTNSLILFDEIDVVFKDDVGFLGAVNHFIKKSKKPILLTTNDDYLQEKINLNIEKIDFVRPRTEAAIKFLKKVASLENKVLDTHTANKLIRDCKFDMRRVLMQFQALYFSSKSQMLANNTNKNGPLIDSFDLNRHLNVIAFSKCKFHNEMNFFTNIFFLDTVTKVMCNFNANIQTDLSDGFNKYDLFILRDGLTDNNSLSSSTASFNPFNPFMPQTTSNALQVNSSDDTVDFNIDDFNKSNSIATRELLHDLYETYMYLFNDSKCVKFQDWYKHGAIHQFSYSSNVSVNRFASNACKLTSNSALSLDYRPYLHQICQIEEFKQATTTSRRRYVNYLSRLSIGLIKEDYTILAKSNLDEQSDQVKSLVEGEKKPTESLFDSNVYSNDS